MSYGQALPDDQQHRCFTIKVAVVVSGNETLQTMPLAMNTSTYRIHLTCASRRMCAQQVPHVCWQVDSTGHHHLATISAHIDHRCSSSGRGRSRQRVLYGSIRVCPVSLDSPRDGTNCDSTRQPRHGLEREHNPQTDVT